MRRERYHQIMYKIAAIWNWVLAIGFIALSKIDVNSFTAFGLPIPPSSLWFDSLFGLVFAFGMIYYVISSDINNNHRFVMIGVFEKTWVFLMGFLHYLAGTASIWVVLVVIVDLIFGILFLEDLLAIRKIQHDG